LGQKQTWQPVGAMSALPPKADIDEFADYVCYPPKADIAERTRHVRSMPIVHIVISNPDHMNPGFRGR
jgi:hypothetical protein